jgi:hypothetical protein
MTAEQQKEQFSIAYVRAVAAAARINIYRMEVDEDSIDIGFSVRSVAGQSQPPRLDGQLKCVTELTLDGDDFRYPLKVKNYNELVGEHYIPKILIVVLVPPAVHDWLSQDQEALVLRRCGYWVSLRQLPSSANVSNVTVEIPRQQVFSVAALQQMLQPGGAP